LASSPYPALIALIALASPVDEQAVPFACPEAIAIPREMAIGTRYTEGDKSYSQIDPAAEAREQAVRQPISAPVSRIARLADRWRNAVDADKPEIAACLQVHFLTQANAQAMMGATSQYDAFYREWMIGSLAISYLKARPGLVSQHGADTLQAWLRTSGQQIAETNIRRLASGKNDNHLYWGGVAAMASGLATDNEKLVAVGRRIRAAGLRAVATNGTLAAELQRRALSFHYHLFAATALSAMIALDPSSIPSSQRAAMIRVATFVAREAGQLDSGVLAMRTGVAQSAEDHPHQFYLIRPWVRDTATIDVLIAGVDPTYQFLGGNLDWLLARLSDPPRSRRPK